jgi:hypothetical protein
LAEGSFSEEKCKKKNSAINISLITLKCIKIPGQKKTIFGNKKIRL